MTRVAFRSWFASAVVGTTALIAGCVTPAPIDLSASQSNPAPAQEYRIGPGDQLHVFVFNQTELTTTVPVRPDGRISTPLVQDMQAAGKTPSELGHDIENALSEFVRAPKVSIIVTNFVGTFADQIRVVGEAVHPQALPYRNGMTLLDVMLTVGGLGQYAAGNRAHLIRRVDGKLVEMRVRLQDLVNGGDLSANVVIQPGDVLSIPQSHF
jgi:polysaccharide biosynthesis/export protein